MNKFNPTKSLRIFLFYFNFALLGSLEKSFRRILSILEVVQFFTQIFGVGDLKRARENIEAL